MEPAVLDGIAQALQACALPPAGAAGEAELQEALWVELLLRYLCRINRFALTLDLADKGAPCPPRRPDDGAGVCPPAAPHALRRHDADAGRLLRRLATHRAG